jgi:hypothetical protein
MVRPEEEVTAGVEAAMVHSNALDSDVVRRHFRNDFSGQIDKGCQIEERARWVLRTRIIVLLKSFAENFKGTAELLGSETGVEGKEDLNNFDNLVRVFGDGTHLDVYGGMQKLSLRFTGYQD